jgi:hypothetical protein
MPLEYPRLAKTNDAVRFEFSRMRRYASPKPDLKTAHRVLMLRGDIAQIVERACQKAVGSYHQLGQLRFVIVTLVCLYETLVTQFPILRTGDVNHHAWKVQQMTVDIRRMSKDELDALNESGRQWRARNKAAQDQEPAEEIAVPEQLDLLL